MLVLQSPQDVIAVKSVKPRGKTCTQECRWVCVVVLGAFMVQSTRLSAQQPAHSTMPDSVRQYVSAAMTALRIHSVHQATVDWHALEDSVVAHSAGAQTPAGTWLPLTSALRSVDPHSFLIPPAAAIAGMFGGMLQAQQPTSHSPHSRLVDGRIGVVVVLPHSGLNRPTYVDSLHDLIAALDGAGACDWVVDLRDNTGGNMGLC